MRTILIIEVREENFMPAKLKHLMAFDESVPEEDRTALLEGTKDIPQIHNPPQFMANFWKVSKMQNGAFLIGRDSWDLSGPRYFQTMEETFTFLKDYYER